MENAIVIVILAALVGGIVWYLWRAKKKGATCIGCAHAKQCRGKCNGACSPQKNEETEKHP